MKISQASRYLFVFWFVLSCFPLTAGAETTHRSTLGETAFPTSAGPEAQAQFLEGLLALHSFEYQDAREFFLAAQKIEPEFAMAYWGEAMTYNESLFHVDDLEKGRAALERLAPTAEERRAKAPTEREKAYFDTVEILFGEGSRLERDLAYLAAMGQLAERFPEDLDAASFYALAILGTSRGGRDTRIYMRAAAVAEEVFAKNPRHPGAAHYLIHAYDDPVHAPLGLRPARVYADVAPAAEHAQHMPSHIFLALGMWPEVISSNLDSAASGEARRVRRGTGVGDRPYHAMLWLQYAYLQLGQVDEAIKLLAQVAEDDRVSGDESDKRTRAALAEMRAIHMVELGDVKHLPPAPDLANLHPDRMASSFYADGLAALARDDLQGCLAVADQMLAQYGLKSPGDEAPKGAARAMAGHLNEEGYSSYGNLDFRPVQIMDLELRAQVHFRAGRHEQAFTLLEEATEIEAQRPFGFGPPIPPKPSHELYGELLLAADRPAGAVEQFEKALERAPRRALALRGLLAAAKRNGDEATARRAAEELESLHPADKKTT